MQVTVLGPWGAYPKAGEATAGYWLSIGGRNLLIDCGSGVLAQLQRYCPLHRLDAAVISHRHYDHVADLGCLQYACLIDTDLAQRSESLPIFIAGEREEDLGYKAMKGSDLHRISDGQTLHVCGVDITFFQTFHGAYCLGMVIQAGGRKLVYTADTYYDESLIAHCEGADVLIAETSFYADMPNAKQYGHMNAAEVGRLAKEAGAAKLVLTHLPHFGERSRLAAQAGQIFGGAIETASCGLSFHV